MNKSFEKNKNNSIVYLFLIIKLLVTIVNTLTVWHNLTAYSIASVTSNNLNFAFTISSGSPNTATWFFVNPTVN